MTLGTAFAFLDKMNPYAWSGLLAGVFSLALGLLTLLKGAKKEVAKRWFLFTLTATVYGFGDLWIALTTTPESALLAWQITFALGVIWMPPLFFHFICTFCELQRPKTLLINYLTSLFFFLFCFSSAFLTTPHLLFDSVYFPTPQFLFHFFLAWWLTFILYCHWVLWKSYRSAPEHKKNQIKYFFLATAIGYIGGSITYFPTYGVALYPYSNFTVFLYPIIMYYAMVRYNLMDIRVLIRRAALLASIYAALILTVTPFIFAFLKNPVSQTSQWITMLIASLVFSSGPFIYAYLIKRQFWLRGNISTGLTHELKSPIHTIQGALEAVQQQMDKPSATKEDLKEYVDMIRKNTDRLNDYVQNLLTIAKIQDGNIELQKEEADLSEIIRASAKSHEPLMQMKKLALSLHLDASATVRIDANKMTQAISNLFSNAIKFTKEGSIQVLLHKNGQGVRFSIEDSGAGIPSSEISKVFDRFYQGKNSSKGSGIGLTIAKAWVEAHGGKIWAESEGEGKGTKILFTLPII